MFIVIGSHNIKCFDRATTNLPVCYKVFCLKAFIAGKIELT